MILAHEPVVLATSPGPVVAMVTEPTAPSVGLGVVLLSPGGYTISSQRNQWGTKLADQLSGIGIHTIRLDYRGIGDSAGEIETFAHELPFIGEGLAAVAELRRRGVDNIVLIGQCFGARTALALAADVEGLRGVFAISPSMRDTGRGEGNASKLAHAGTIRAYLRHAVGVFDPRMLRDRGARRRYRRMAKTFVKARLTKLMNAVSNRPPDATPWVSRGLLEQVTRLVDRRIALVFVYGSAEEDSDDFAAAKRGWFGGVIASSQNVEEHLLPGRVHNLGRVDIQDQLVEMMVTFAAGRAVEKTGSVSP